MSRFSGRIEFAGGQLDLTGRTLVMGILNVTPDSFSDGGIFLDQVKAIEHGLLMAGQGADILDVGGQSTRPGAEPVSAEEQKRRVVPVIRELACKCGVPISIDTDNSVVAEAALEAGATIINDITALRGDPAMAALAAGTGAAVILMHMQGTPRTMQDNPRYENVVAEVEHFLRGAVEQAQRGGIDRGRIIIDPGIGFGKRLEDNLKLLRHVDVLLATGLPVLVGPSRKQFIGTILDAPVDQRLFGTLGTVGYLATKGVHIVRVHDVKQTCDVVRVIDAIQRAAG